MRLTSDYFVDIIEDEVHEGVVTFQRALDCEDGVVSICSNGIVSGGMALRIPSRPPLNLTLICLSMYLARSRIFSFLGRSRSPDWLPPPAPPPPRPPPLPPRKFPPWPPPPPRPPR